MERQRQQFDESSTVRVDRERFRIPRQARSPVALLLAPRASQLMPSVLSTCCPPARSESCPTCGGDRCSACHAPHRSTPGIFTCLCSNTMRTDNARGHVHVHGFAFNVYRAQGLTPPVAIGIPVALNVFEIGREGPPAWPVGRPLRLHYMEYDMEEVG